MGTFTPQVLHALHAEKRAAHFTSIFQHASRHSGRLANHNLTVQSALVHTDSLDQSRWKINNSNRPAFGM